MLCKMANRMFKPRCEKCGRKSLLDNGLCAICFQNKYGRWSGKFTSKEKGGKKKT